MMLLCHAISQKSHCFACTCFAVFTPYAFTVTVKRLRGPAMPLDLFSRKLVLLVEDEPLIAHDVEHHLRKAGVHVITAGHLDVALAMAEHPDLSGAVIDLRLRDDCATPLCRRLAQRNVPFVIYTGYPAEAVQREWPTVPIIRKPARLDEITDALSRSGLFENP
jgi:ActR/RegA family two-component response regulator